MKNFKQLMIWQKGMQIWKETYAISKDLPESERFGVTSQMNRASISISANIAEGASRDSAKDFHRFLQIALGSAFELETFLIGIKMLEMIKDAACDNLLALIEEEQKMLMAFMKKLK